MLKHFTSPLWVFFLPLLPRLSENVLLPASAWKKVVMHLITWTEFSWERNATIFISSHSTRALSDLFTWNVYKRNVFYCAKLQRLSSIIRGICKLLPRVNIREWNSFHGCFQVLKSFPFHTVENRSSRRLYVASFWLFISLGQECCTHLSKGRNERKTFDK